MRNVITSFLGRASLGGAGLLAATIVASADNIVTLTQNPAYSYSDAGAFNAVTTENFGQNYAPVATQGGGFQTFCVESTVTFNPNTSYYYTLSDQDSQGRALTLGAAYLYYEFATGQLPGYFGANQSTEAGLLQSAIWELQGNQSLGGFPSYTTDPFYMLATNTFGGAAGAGVAANGAYNVDVLQMWDSPTSHVPGQDDHQNQMVYLGVPDNFYTGIMVSLAAISLAIAARRTQKPAAVMVSRPRR